VKEAPKFQASPAPTEEETAAIAAALVLYLESEATARATAAEPSGDAGGLSRWVAEGRGEQCRRGVTDYRHLVGPLGAWRLSGRAPVWGAFNP
jgi:hypothetical protein